MLRLFSICLAYNLKQTPERMMSKHALIGSIRSTQRKNTTVCVSMTRKHVIKHLHIFICPHSDGAAAAEFEAAGAAAAASVAGADFFVGVSPKCAFNDSLAAFSISTASSAAASDGECSALATSPSCTLSRTTWIANTCPIIFVLVSSSYTLALLKHNCIWTLQSRLATHAGTGRVNYPCEWHSHCSEVEWLLIHVWPHVFSERSDDNVKSVKVDSRRKKVQIVDQILRGNKSTERNAWATDFPRKDEKTK